MTPTQIDPLMSNPHHQERCQGIREIAARVWLGRSADPDIEIDADAAVSIASDGSGAWVHAWLWVDGEHFTEGHQIVAPALLGAVDVTESIRVGGTPATERNPRCWRCGKKLAELLTRPWEITCGRCKARNRATGQG